MLRRKPGTNLIVGTPRQSAKYTQINVRLLRTAQACQHHCHYKILEIPTSAGPIHAQHNRNLERYVKSDQERLSRIRERTHNGRLAKVDLIEDKYAQPNEADDQGRQDATRRPWVLYTPPC